MPGLRPPWRAGGAVQGAEHVEQLHGLRRPGRRHRRDRPRAVGPGGGGGSDAGAGDEPGPAEARRRPAQPRGGDGSAGRRDLLGRLRRRPPPPGRRGVRRVRRPRGALRRGGLRGRGQPRGDQPARGRLRQHGAGPARRHPDGRGRRHRPGRRVRRDVYGTLALLDPDDQALVAGFVVNKFRGDESLLAPGLERLPRAHPPADVRRPAVAPRPVAGLRGRPRPGRPPVRRPARRAARRRRTTAADQQLHRRRRARPRARRGRGVRLDAAGAGRRRPRRGAGHPRHHRRPGLAARARAGPRDRPPRRTRWAGARHLRRLPDARGPDRRPRRRRGAAGSFGAGAGAARCHHDVRADKVLRLPTGAALGATTTGYEIHHGRVRVDGDEEFLGGARRGAVFGTMWHGSLEGDGFRHALLAEVAAAAGREWRPSDVRFAERARGPTGPARRPGREAPGRRRPAPARRVPARPDPPRPPSPGYPPCTCRGRRPASRRAAGGRCAGGSRTAG